MIITVELTEDQAKGFSQYLDTAGGEEVGT